MSIVWRRDTLRPNVETADERAFRAVRLIIDYWATRAVTEMRQNASWTDRTTAARNGLAARRFDEGNHSTALVLWHSVPYGIWLEVRWSGRYAIIGPTMHDIAPRVLSMAGEAAMRNMRV